MKHLIIAFALLIGTATIAQKTISHIVEYDDPYKENLDVTLNLFTADFYLGAEDKKDIEPGAAIGWGLQTQYGNIADRLTAELSLRQNYATALSGKKSLFFDLGITWDIAQGRKKVANDIKIGEGYNTVSMMTDVQMTRGDHFRVRAGFTSTSAAIIVPYRVQILQNGAKVNGTGVYAGLEYCTNINYKTLVNGFTPRRFQHAFRIYGDVITTPIGGYGDSLYINGLEGGGSVLLTDEISNELDSIGARTKNGFRLGLSYMISLPGGLAFTSHMYGGIKPPFTGAYVYLGLGMTYNFKTSFLGNREMKMED